MSGDGVTVLAVDDSPDQLMLAAAALTQAGFAVVEAENGEEALALAAEFKPDAILLDVVMPGMSGFRVCEVLRGRPDSADTPIMIATGLDDVGSVERAYEAGATDFVTKPINWALLGHRVRYMLRAASTARRLGVSERRFEALFAGAAVGIVATDPRGLIVAANPAFTQMLTGPEKAPGPQAAPGEVLDDAALIGRPLRDLTRDEDRSRQRAALEALLAGAQERDEREERYVRGDGGAVDAQVRSALVTDDAGAPLYVISSVEDMTERRRMEAHLKDLASYDSLTRLPNRSLFKDVLEQALTESARRKRGAAAVLVLDLDRFKTINDSLGAKAGDEVLKKAAARLASCLRDADMLGEGARIDGVAARIDGDTFAVVMRELASHRHAGAVAARLIERLNEPMRIDGEAVRLGASVGVAIHPADGETTDALFANAEAAMYDAKRRGRNCHQFYAMAMNEAAQARLSWENDLRQALEDEAFELFYQPQVDLESGALLGVEALLRWPRQDGVVASPDRFIGLAEEMGLIDRLGAFALERACRDISRWEEASLPSFRVAVNLSGRQFADKKLADAIRAIVAGADVDPRRICLEVTESAAMLDVENAIATLAELRDRGFHIAIDDFGTGYSSLSQLRRLPLDELKIDRSFVAAIDEDEAQAVFVEIIVSLALALGLEIVAEGIEKNEQAEILRGFGARIGQGYLYGKAMSARDLVAWTRERRPRKVVRATKADIKRLKPAPL